MLQQMIDWILYTLLSLDPTGRVVESLDYFLYDSIKILFLLFIMIFVMGVLRSYISAQRIKKTLKKTRFFIGNIMASLFGAITPFCSCSSIPLFFSFLRSGVPLGISFSFLITSPLVNEYVVVILFALFGWKVAIAYALTGILLGIVLGIILSKMNLEKHLVQDMVIAQKKEQSFKMFSDRVHFGLDEALGIVKKMWLWILLGVAVGAAIHNLVPLSMIQSFSDATGIFAVPLVVLIGIPLYGSCAAIAPIAAALFAKGVPLGTALALLMSISALSFPEAILLRRAMKLKLILIFFAIVGLSLIAIGYLFNALQGTLMS